MMKMQSNCVRVQLVGNHMIGFTFQIIIYLNICMQRERERERERERPLPLFLFLLSTSLKFKAMFR